MIEVESPANGFSKLITDEYVPDMSQMGLDMLYRLKLTNRIIEYLLGVGQVNNMIKVFHSFKIMDALEIAKKERFQDINPKLFLEAAIKEGSSVHVNDVISFFLNVGITFKC